ncbi:MAG: IPTL-CTERM sorting domain-containing protein [Uliginosibacterium sp.]|nr:IPTL-CTERM sorting domain-containing protein [Uliginosibacterium sp.]
MVDRNRKLGFGGDGLDIDVRADGPRLGVDEVKFLVNAPLSISSRFEPAVIDEGGNTTIIYTLTNPTSLNATGINFRATGSEPGCSPGGPIELRGTAEMHIKGITPSAVGNWRQGQSCTISFPVTASVARIIPGGRLPRVVANIGVLEPQWPNGGGTELTVRALATPASPPPAVPASPPPGTPQPVPTLGEWGMIGLAGLLALLGARRLRRV